MRIYCRIFFDKILGNRDTKKLVNEQTPADNAYVRSFGEQLIWAI